jgi:DNA-binding MarR family transcriptional regulator
VDDVPASLLTDSLTFRLGLVGAVVTERFARATAEYDVKPKHVGLLAVLNSGGPASQLDLAKIMHVAPSFMVTLVDHLERLGAIQRARDPADRRRQIVSLTPAGDHLLAMCARAAQDLDSAVTGALTREQKLSLGELLGAVIRHNGLAVAEGSSPDAATA